MSWRRLPLDKATRKASSRLAALLRRLPGREWDADPNAWGTERRVRADVFVFAVHTEAVPEGYDKLDLSK
jgi:hypothetical protein